MKTLLFLLLTFSMAGCGLLPAPKQPFRLPPEYQDRMALTRFGEWIVEKETCTLVAGSYPLRVETQGRIENERLYFKLTSVVPLQTFPVISINTLEGQGAITVEGKGKAFGFELPAHAAAFAQMRPDYAFLFITYTLTTDQEPKQLYLQTAGMLKGINHLQSTCRKK